MGLDSLQRNGGDEYDNGQCEKPGRLRDGLEIDDVYHSDITTSSNQATLTLSPSASASLSGYDVYVGTVSGQYNQKFNAGDVTTYTVGNLSSGTTYYFAVTSYDSSVDESPYSNEVSKAIPKIHTDREYHEGIF